ncbi:MAG: sulfatase-like hydrolase/transferase [Elusimicrobia bacterium]|nr:sulfatase-like hydrolase/transferase [Elusimicrobiota bacterium]
MVKQYIKRIITLNIIFALIMTIYRAIFTFYYSSWSVLSQYLGDLIQVFILGLRYDCAILAYINLPNWIDNFGYQQDIRNAFADFYDIDISFIDKTEPEQILLKTTKYNKTIEDLKPNIILIIAESLGMDFMQYNNEEFNIIGELKKHLEEDIVFYNCLYSYFETQVSVNSIFFNYIELPKVYNYKFDYNPIFTFLCSDYFIKNIYKNNKFVTYNLSDGLIDLSDNLFDNVESCKENDELIYNNIFKVLEENNKQKFIFVVTKTNHHPYNLPENYKLIDYKIPKDINNCNIKGINTFMYSCQKLGEFLTKLKKSKYADNTIVAVVGDHNSRLIFYDMPCITFKSVPFYLYIPEKIKPNKELIDTSKVISHIDIMPTLIELSLSNVKYYSLGRNVFDKNYQNAISVNYDYAIVVNGDDMCVYFVDFDEIKSYKLIREKNKLAKCNETEQIEQTLKHKKMIKQYKAMVAIFQYLLEKTIINKKKEECNNG